MRSSPLTAKCVWMLGALSANSLTPSARLGICPGTQLSPKTQPAFSQGTDRAEGEHQTSPAPHSMSSSTKGDISALNPKPQGPRQGRYRAMDVNIALFPSAACRQSPLPLPDLGVCSLSPWCPPDGRYDLKLCSAHDQVMPKRAETFTSTDLEKTR